MALVCVKLAERREGSRPPDVPLAGRPSIASSSVATPSPLTPAQTLHRYQPLASGPWRHGPCHGKPGVGMRCLERVTMRRAVCREVWSASQGQCGLLPRDRRSLIHADQRDPPCPDRYSEFCRGLSARLSQEPCGRTETVGGLVVLVAAVIALIWVDTPLSGRTNPLATSVRHIGPGFGLVGAALDRRRSLGRLRPRRRY